MKNLKLFCSAPAIILLFLAIFASLNKALAQTPELDELFYSHLSQVKGAQEDTSNVVFEASFPGEAEWEKIFNEKWLPAQAQVQSNLEAINKSQPNAQQRIMAEKSSAISQYKSLAEEVEITLLRRAQIVYNAALSELEQLNLSPTQRKRELSELAVAFEKSKQLIKGKRQEIANRFNPQPVVEVKKATVISEKTN